MDLKTFILFFILLNSCYGGKVPFKRNSTWITPYSRITEANILIKNPTVTETTETNTERTTEISTPVNLDVSTKQQESIKQTTITPTSDTQLFTNVEDDITDDSPDLKTEDEDEGLIRGVIHVDLPESEEMVEERRQAEKERELEVKNQEEIEHLKKSFGKLYKEAFKTIKKRFNGTDLKEHTDDDIQSSTESNKETTMKISPTQISEGTTEDNDKGNTKTTDTETETDVNVQLTTEKLTKIIPTTTLVKDLHKDAQVSKKIELNTHEKSKLNDVHKDLKKINTSNPQPTIISNHNEKLELLDRKKDLNGSLNKQLYEDTLNVPKSPKPLRETEKLEVKSMELTNKSNKHVSPVEVKTTTTRTPPSEIVVPSVSVTANKKNISTGDNKTGAYNVYPVVRVESPIQEKIESLNCDISAMSDDAKLWKGNETHEMLLPEEVSVAIFVIFSNNLFEHWLFLEASPFVVYN